jgi:hypothetical protein
LCARFPPRGEAGDVKIWGGRSPRPPLKLVIADFFITAATNSVRAAGKKKKRIFLCARFLPRGEAGDVKIWGGCSLRPPLELVIVDFLIIVATNSVHTTGIGVAGKQKKRIFLCARFLLRGEAGDAEIWGGGAL